MLHVNLIQERLRVRQLRSFVARFGGIGLVGLCAVVIVLLGFQFVEGMNIKKERAKVEVEIEKLRPQADQCRLIQGEIEGLLPLWELTDEVVESQQIWSLVLRGISVALPPGEGVVLHSMNVTTGVVEGETVTKIMLVGTAPDEFAVASYIRRLNSLEEIFDPEGTNLSNVAIAEQEEVEVRRFNLELKLVGRGGKLTS